ncbi:alpha/beta fold hydrolase [Streptomyces sp. H39-S7]|uniref:alpha/beta fold hydrolase n=1 Tax=Streptomyces sp. H39-S7 TaxID=3004357 RepID=UPI0022B030BF|nr:alpha/beta hydrolase [Streptomyces sp. H39-S7]MCZ4122794.1 alpha/beta hydrolase [Streptomyces sp. H39-S7]
MTTDPRIGEFRTSDDLTLRYYSWGEVGELPPVLLLHGFAVHARSNWEDPGVVAALLGHGRHVVALDARGHGASDRPHDPARYGEVRMARDVTELIDVLGVGEVHLAGYSMGAVVALLATAADRRVTRLVTGGVGAGVVEVGGLDRRAIPTELVTAALNAEDPADAPAQAAGFRLLADAVGADRQALVAQLTAAFRGPMPLADIRVPFLVLAGSEDPLAVRPEVLADAVAGAELSVLPGDHLTVVRDPRFAAAVAAFLSARDKRG